MILVDEAYEAACTKTRAWAKRLLLDRFKAVFGERGGTVLSELDERMAANIRSDSRRDP